MPSLSALQRALRPRGVAVYGASDDVSKFGGATMAALRNQDFKGTLVPITSRQREVFGMPAQERLAGTGIEVDLVLIAVPRPHVADCLRDAAAAGAACAVIITAGYADAGNEDGQVAERELVELAASLGIRLVGPNCNGVMVGIEGLYLGPNMLARKVPQLAAGPLCLICQSGSVMGTLMAQAYAMGMGTGLCVSLGNQADLDACDFLEFAIAQPELTVIALYLEQVTNPARLRVLFRQARAEGKQVLAIKAGRTDVGAQAAMSHTGSLVGSYAVFEAACQQDGVIVCESLRETVVAAWAVTHFAALQPTQVGLVSPSGGAVGILADRLSEEGFQQPELQPATWESAAAELPAQYHHFPADLGVLMQYLPNFGADTMTHFCRTVMDDPDVGALVLQATTVIGAKRLAEAAARASEVNKPFLIVDISGGLNSELQEALSARGIPCLFSEDDLLYALRALRQKAAAQARKVHAPEQVSSSPSPVPVLPALPTEDELKSYLASFGVPVVEERVVRSEDEAVAAAEEVGYPAVLKVRIRHIAHKTEVGGVALGLSDAAAVRAAFADMAHRLADQAGPEGFACVVQAMMKNPVAELLVGARREPGFGTFIVLGAGGTLVELLDDTCMLPVPASAEEIAERLQTLRVAQLMNGYRGRVAVNVQLVGQTIARISEALAALGDRLQEVDINPLLITPEGPVVVDAAASLVAP